MFVDSKYLCSIARAPSEKTRFRDMARGLEKWQRHSADAATGAQAPHSPHPGKKRALSAPARRDVSGDDEDGSAAQNARAGSSDERVVDN
ncbi:hypothetical protein PI124_g18768 [Phytophthora idaei]|nr:hypothetical protein PI125_g17033 [Phytophthora idaei]KAG3149843.1 hypothetical protein PI126_g11827 [Phytophthora idaei]KAG3236225.1 hypothetical protein PI124_g18768 [Phytophthora idaei]